MFVKTELTIVCISSAADVSSIALTVSTVGIEFNKNSIFWSARNRQSSSARLVLTDKVCVEPERYRLISDEKSRADDIDFPKETLPKSNTLEITLTSGRIPLQKDGKGVELQRRSLAEKDEEEKKASRRNSIK
jgi:hypothetical protein